MITLTEQAISHFNKMHTRQRPETYDIRGYKLELAPAGCSGYEYKIKPVMWEDEAVALKRIHVEPTSPEHWGWQFYIAERDEKLVDGTTIDYVRVGLGEKIVFNNPNEQGRCGCGTSVML